jgi:hypothetical protein
MVFIIFITIIQEWWIGYDLAHDVANWSLLAVLFQLVYPILLFTLARMLFPTGLRGHEKDLHAYYFDQWPWFFRIYLFIPLISIIHNVYFFGHEFTEQVTQIVLVVLLAVFLIFKIRNFWAHFALLWLISLAWIAYLITDSSTLGG